jgi:hypothetical protein
MPSLNAKEQQEALEAVIARAAVDREFRSQLLTNPHEAIRQSFGIRVPEQFRVKFIEKSPDVDALIVLPDFEAAGGELSDSELEAVSGGVGRDMTWSSERHLGRR